MAVSYLTQSLPIYIFSGTQDFFIFYSRFRVREINFWNVFFLSYMKLIGHILNWSTGLTLAGRTTTFHSPFQRLFHDLSFDLWFQTFLRCFVFIICSCTAVRCIQCIAARCIELGSSTKWYKSLMCPSQKVLVGVSMYVYVVLRGRPDDVTSCVERML